MVLVTGTDRLMSLGARGRFGYSNGFGRIVYGSSAFGLLSDFCGIYSRKKTKSGHGISRMTFYSPTNPQTPLQQSWRAVFSAGWTQYALLTESDKVRLSIQARRLRMSGPQLFMRRWLCANRA